MSRKMKKEEYIKKYGIETYEKKLDMEKENGHK